MKKTGEILKAAREAKGLSLNEVGLSLKISSKVLKAIEDGDEKQLPAKTFLRGFVKSYATLLHLDADQVLEQFYQEMGSTRPQPYIRPTTTPSEKESSVVEAPVEKVTAAPVEPIQEATVTPLRKEAATPPPRAGAYSPLQEKKNTKTIAVFVILAVLVGLILFTKRMIDKYSKEAEVPSAEVAQTMEGATTITPAATETPAPVESMNPQASPAPSPLSNITSHPDADKSTPATMATPSHSPTPTPTTTPVTQAATPTPSPTASAKASPTPSPSPVASATPAVSPSPSPTPKEEKNKPVELIVEALDTVEIEYSAPNGKPQKIKLSSEQVHTFKSKSGLKISFSNGGAVNLILNGKEVGIPGDLGKPIKLSY